MNIVSNITTLFYKVSDGGVHSHINHLFSMIEAAKLLQVPKCFIQFFSDGRDTRPVSGGMSCCLKMKSPF